MKKKFFVFITALFMFAVFTDCRKDKYFVPVCYDNDVQPILTNKCTMSGCHNTSDKAAELDLTSYAAYQNSRKKDILSSINDGSMPPKNYMSLTVPEKEIIARWAAQNYSKGDCNNNLTVCDTTQNITYTNTIKNIFDTYCIGCHSASNPSAGVQLDNYNAAISCDNTQLLGTIKWLQGYNPMPQGGSKLSDCNIAKIQKWINSGKPN